MNTQPISTLNLVTTFFLIILLTGLISPVYARGTAVFVGSDFNNKPCSGSHKGYGPFDYMARGRLQKELKIVENYHFTPEVEALIRGSTNTVPYGDLAYTLRAWPNHHRALNAMARYNLRLNRQNKHIPIAAECWFQRAIAFSPKDATTYMVFAMYLHNSHKLKQSENYYKIALDLDPENIQAHYNFGLLLLDKKKYDQARTHARIAYKNKYPFPGLKQKLAAVGYWP